MPIATVDLNEFAADRLHRFLGWGPFLLLGGTLPGALYLRPPGWRHLVLVEYDLSLVGLEALLEGPAGDGDRDHARPRVSTA